MSGSAISFSWDTKGVADGAYTLAVTVTDAAGATASSSTLAEKLDNTPPTTYVLSPAAGTWVTGTLAVQAHGSDANGIRQIQFEIDGTVAGAPVTTPDATGGGYTYSAALDISALANGAHALTDVATDNAGNTTTATPVTFDVGIAPLSVTITEPTNLSFALGVTSVATSISGGTGPYSVVLLVDGVASGAAVASPPYTLLWNTTTLADGLHSIAVTVTDSAGAHATSTVFNETVDNTPPTGVMYEPTQGMPACGPTSFQVHASDANGVASVRFAVDGAAVGALLTAPDAGQQYLYTIAFDTSVLAAGTHAISAIVTDNAGNTAIAPAVSITTGMCIPVLNYHGIDASPPDEYEITPATAEAQLKYLQDNGYQSVTLEQYQAWLEGQDIGVTKPVLITVDDGLTDQLAWDTLLQQYGFTAVMFVVTGFADNTTPGDTGPQNLTWVQLQALAADGRWEIGFHAGTYGHGDAYGSGQTAGGHSYSSTCPYFYTCLGTGESVADYEAAVTTEVAAGVAELQQEIPSASSVAWTAPFNDAGQWTTDYNDPTVESWFPGYTASQFPITFMQTSWVEYAGADGLVGGLKDFGRRYRFEVHSDTTIQQFAAALADPAFAR
ncbi:MAG TPA: Ig-like domain-containing protein [Gaiellaceae bacterium]|nr:Ig-like domain-containing protein [Gaiellaceae bacterium]